jgi:hypothetical protein
MDSNMPRLLDQVRAVRRRKHYALRTEEAYVGWVKRFVLFHHKSRSWAVAARWPMHWRLAASPATTA